MLSSAYTRLPALQLTALSTLRESTTAKVRPKRAQVHRLLARGFSSLPLDSSCGPSLAYIADAPSL